MIDDLKPYPEMKDSGAPWLGQVPNHWEIGRSRRLFSLRTELARPDDVQLSATQAYGVIAQSDFERKVGRRVVRISMHMEKRRHVEKDDFVISMRSFQGGLERAWVSGCIRSSYVVLKPSEYVDVRFFAYLFKSYAYVRALQATANFIRDGQDLNFKNFSLVDLPIIPLEEQRLIARFLSHADAHIARYISAKQKLINLLYEQVTARAAEAMRHSSCRMERLATIATQEFRPVVRDDAQSYVALGLYNRGRGIFHKPATPGTELGDSTFFWVMPGDLVISGQFAWEGAVAIASGSELNTIVSHRYYVLRGIEGRATTPYLWALLRSDFGSMLLDQHSRGAAGRNRPLNLGRLLKERVPVPHLETQLALDELIESIAPIRARVASDIALLREYRTRLIADVVTGKLDVREAAAKLPDILPEAETLDETDDLPQDEEMAEDGEIEAEDAA